MELSSIEALLLEQVQKDFPLESRPFRMLGSFAGLSEESAIDCISKFKDTGIIRQISPIFDSNKIGYQSTLAAFKVNESMLNQAITVLNAHNGVSHNYLRAGEYNVWFTLTVHNKFDFMEVLSQIYAQAGADSMLFLPSVKTFKIGFGLKFTNKNNVAPVNFNNSGISQTHNKYQIMPEFIKIAQDDFSLVKSPYQCIADKFQCSEAQVFSILKSYKEQKIIRRIAAVLRPHNAGFSKNVMIAWEVASENRDTLGTFASSLDSVSHCYERVPAPDWPYTVYTMVHCRDDGEIDSLVKKIKSTAPVISYCILPTLKEFKKVRVRYFEENV